MRRSRFTEEQIVGILKEQGGWPTDGGCLPRAWDQRGARYKWKAKSKPCHRKTIHNDQCDSSSIAWPFFTDDGLASGLLAH